MILNTDDANLKNTSITVAVSGKTLLLFTKNIRVNGDTSVWFHETWQIFSSGRLPWVTSFSWSSVKE